MAHDFAMASDAIFEDYVEVLLFDEDGVPVVAGDKGNGVGPPIEGFGMPFAEETFWGVAAVTVCMGSMAGVQKRFVLLSHHVAVGAGGGVIAKV
jgi:hypothetical protein